MAKPSISHLIEALSPSPLAYKHLREVLINKVLCILIEFLISRLISRLMSLPHELPHEAAAGLSTALYFLRQAVTQVAALQPRINNSYARKLLSEHQL
ncbi:uncharacterized protein BDZ99DRAFT_146392 [Mytilinidion resinicola]|uniref:Uncharacterized protein n=1 Tax=Mytilinidion resinicola TaxID=574789 RepID=A0A6A6Y8T5_9PEZI|nr:uncharacterized protein BDZ99DRAFT_146392 [Mytilinidion resinicola]KAF2804968.1 hypothetical protein BDZ99DRAFT_146392 [Mytilinidion resinicola]